MSFIDLKMLSCSCNMSVLLKGLVKGRWVGLRCEISWNLQAKLCSDTLDAVLRMPQSVDECCDLDAWLRPDRLQKIGGVKCEIGMFYEPLVEQRNIMSAMRRILAKDMEQFDGVGEIALIIRLCRGDDCRGDEIVLRPSRLHQES